MTKPALANGVIEALVVLGEPNRLRLYELVAASREAIGRDEAAAALAISRELAAFHLDRLVQAGLLDTEYRRLGGRSGPGAGRPAKLYRRAERDVSLSIPPRHYDVAADVLAEGLDRLDGALGADAVGAVARERGTAIGLEARRKAGPRPGGGRLRSALLDVLRDAGYAPMVDGSSGSVCLGNCPYHALAESHRALTCGMNLAWAGGVVDALAGSSLRPELDPKPGYCCVVFRPIGDRAED